jgi:hypothetical protein
MKTIGCVWAVVAAFLLTDGPALAGEEGPAGDIIPAAAEGEAVGDNCWSGMGGHHGDPCKPGCVGENRLFCPFELYGRVGVNFVAAKDGFNDLYHTGLELQFGAKALCYQGEQGALFGEFGIDYYTNGGRAGAEAVVIENQRFAPPEKPIQLQRVYLRAGAGYDWYWPICDSCRAYAEIDGGGKLGHAHGSFEDVPNQTDVAWAIYAGAGAGVLIPQCGFDIVVGARAEISHEWISLIVDREGLDTGSLFLTAGLRY